MPCSANPVTPLSAKLLDFQEIIRKNHVFPCFPFFAEPALKGSSLIL